MTDQPALSACVANSGMDPLNLFTWQSACVNKTAAINRMYNITRSDAPRLSDSICYEFQSQCVNEKLHPSSPMPDPQTCNNADYSNSYTAFQKRADLIPCKVAQPSTMPDRDTCRYVDMLHDQDVSNQFSFGLNNYCLDKQSCDSYMKCFDQVLQTKPSDNNWPTCMNQVCPQQFSKLRQIQKNYYHDYNRLSCDLYQM